MNINFDDIYYEEFQFDINIKPGDILSINQKLALWHNNQWVNFNHTHYIYYINNTIDKIELSNDVNSNPYGYNDQFQKIPDNIIIFSIKNFPFWFKYNKNIKIN